MPGGDPEHLRLPYYRQGGLALRENLRGFGVRSRLLPQKSRPRDRSFLGVTLYTGGWVVKKADRASDARQGHRWETLPARA